MNLYRIKRDKLLVFEGRTSGPLLKLETHRILFIQLVVIVCVVQIVTLVKSITGDIICMLALDLMIPNITNVIMTPILQVSRVHSLGYSLFISRPVREAPQQDGILGLKDTGVFLRLRQVCKFIFFLKQGNDRTWVP